MNPASYGEQPGACAFTTQGSQGPDRITRNGYDPAGQLLTVEKAVGTPIAQVYARYEYTPNGKQKAVTDANGNRAEMRYDGYGRQSHWIFPSPAPAGQPGHGTANLADYEAYDYDLAGNRRSLRKRDGAQLNFTWDAMNRLERKEVPASATGAPGYTVAYGYDLQGLQTSAAFASGGGVTNVYDKAGRLTSATTAMGGATVAIGSTWDEDGNRTGVNGMVYSYDGLDRLTGIFNGSLSGPLASFDYAADGSLSSIGSRWGAVETAATRFERDSVGRLGKLTQALAGGASNETAFTYNPASQIVTRGIGNSAYVWSAPYAVSRSYTPNGLNQYGTVRDGQEAPRPYGYDANGNFTSDGSSTFVYDAENRLVSARGARKADLEYDPLGRLSRVWDPTTAASTATRFYYDGDRLAFERSDAGALRHFYVHGNGPDQPLVWWDLTGANTRRFLHADQQGSIVAVSNGQTGGPVAVDTYDPWGVPGSGNMAGQRFGYTGQAWIPELGMYYYKARFYWPMLGRFLQTDPVGYEDQVNLYAYVGNDPLDKRDPSGKIITGPEDREQRQRLERMINARAGQGNIQYVFRGKDNHLVRQSDPSRRGVTGTRLGVSSYYSKRLDQAIASKGTINIHVQQTAPDEEGSLVNIDTKWGGGVTIPDGKGNQDFYVTGHSILNQVGVGGRIRMDGGDILAHELVGHAIPRLVGTDTGNAIANENKVRAETGAGLRLPDPDHEE